MKIENEWLKRFLLGASLILFAGVVFYIVAPKWESLHVGRRFNKVTGQTFQFTGSKWIQWPVKTKATKNASESAVDKFMRENNL